jgi:hypothetical protein
MAKKSFKSWAAKGDNAYSEIATDKPIRTLKQAAEIAEIDTKEWEIDRWTCSQWTTPLKVEQGQDNGGRWKAAIPIITQQFMVKVWLKRKAPSLKALESLVEEIRNSKLQLPSYTKPRSRKGGHHRALEISIMDPHLGMLCHQPQADQPWSLDTCEQAFQATLEKLLEAAEVYGPFDEIVTAIGNDYLHTDNLQHSTTGGTLQPEMVSMHETYLRGKKLLLWKLERLRSLAPGKLTVLHVPGNHDRFSSYTLAHLAHAFYEGAKVKNVFVDASASPYKFWKFGVNLIGFEHGHSIKPIRLAAVMANETRLNGWREARYCEWHVGDQHRKGSGKPSMHEEQGVSVEYLPALTPPNEWHRLKSFNWQKRGAMAFVYDHDRGPISRLQVNFDSYTGRHLGE